MIKVRGRIFQSLKKFRLHVELHVTKIGERLSDKESFALNRLSSNCFDVSLNKLSEESVDYFLSTRYAFFFPTKHVQCGARLNVSSWRTRDEYIDCERAHIFHYMLLQSSKRCRRIHLSLSLSLFYKCNDASAFKRTTCALFFYHSILFTTLRTKVEVEVHMYLENGYSRVTCF